jgi:small-conductance mechanosensitive channel
MPMDPAILTEFKSSLQEVYDELDGDFWNTDDDSVEAVDDLANSVNDALTALNQAGIGQDDATLQAIKGQVAAINKQLQAAQTKIDNWVKDVAYAGKIAQLLDKAIQLGVQLMK